MDLDQPTEDVDVLKKIERMGVMINQRYEAIKMKWIDKDQLAMQLGIVVAINLFLFHAAVNLSGCTFEHGVAGLAGLAVSIIVYAGSGIFKLYGLWVPTIVCLVISNG